jgi:chromosomal replication initiation ATPase DnaA
MHFGGRDHTTELHACKDMGSKTKKEHRIGAVVGELKNELSFALN